MKSSLFLMAALSLIVASQPVSAADPTKSTGKSAVSDWPKWYYYDQLGLREWNKGDRPRAKQYFEQSLRLAESSLHGQASLDPVTKRRAKEMLKHQNFLSSYFVKPPEQALRGLSTKEAMAHVNEVQIEDTKDKLRWMDRLINFSEQVFGKNNYEAQDIRKMKSLYRMRVVQLKREVENLRGWPVESYDNGGTEVSDEKKTKGPKWYTGSTSESWNKKRAQEADAQRQQAKRPDWFNRNSKSTGSTGTTTSSATQSSQTPVYNRTYQEAKGTMYVGGKPVPRNEIEQLPRQGKIAEGDSPREWGHNPRQFNQNRSTNLWGQAPQKSD
ncbi:MAG TPA: hypothetical protein PKC98_14435, partial [Candidatus Melainabacteria bacterium]|nr:hypothetical protein [Candidatus Melainabacteria bacterium]